MSPVRAAAYVRVSSRQQSFGLQKDAIERAAAARGDEIAELFEEKRSGASRQRPELDKLRASVRAGGVVRIYVFRIDRLTRLGIRDTLGLLEEFRGAGARVVSVADGFDLDGPAGDVIAAVMAWAAQIERLATGERISAARERVEAAGGNWGRRRRIDPQTLAAAKGLRAKGLSLRVVAGRLKVPKATLQRALAGKGHYKPT
jgi:DNA invertase Pin-like site-specific DNA recombinase